MSEYHKVLRVPRNKTHPIPLLEPALMDDQPAPLSKIPAPAPESLQLSADQRLRLMLRSSVEQWITQRAASKGAALAFYTLFSMAPILVLVLAIVGTVFDSDVAQKEIFSQLTALIGPSSSDAIQVLLAGAHNPVSGRIATAVATVILLIGATSVFAELKASLDEIWQVPPNYQPGILGLIRTRLLSFGLVLVLAFLLLVSLVISAGLAILEHYWVGWAQNVLIISPLSSFFSFAVIACMFAVIYKMLPQIKLSWSDVWIGAVGTAGLFSLGKYGIGVYLGNSAIASGYGAAGSVVALLLWIYYSSQIFFLGAEFTRQYAEYFGSLQNSRRNQNK